MFLAVTTHRSCFAPLLFTLIRYPQPPSLPPPPPPPPSSSLTHSVLLSCLSSLLTWFCENATRSFPAPLLLLLQPQL